MAAKEIFGYTSEEMQGELFTNIVPIHRNDEWFQNFSIILNKGKIFTEFEFQKKDGTIFPVELRSFLIKNDTGKDEYIWSCVRDISKQKKAEEKLINKEKFLFSIIENIPDMIYIKDINNLKYVHLNKAGENILGYSKEDIIGSNDYDFFTKEMADLFTNTDQAVIKYNKQLHIPEEFIDAKNGRKILSTKKLTIPDKNGKPAYLLGISRDITERRLGEAKIIKSEAYYHTLINISPDGILVTDLKGNISFGSEKLFQLFEVPDNLNIIGQSAYNWIASESIEDAKSIFRNVINGDTVCQPCFIKCLKFDRTEFWGELSFSLLCGSSGNPIGLMIICRDISERKRMVEKLNIALHMAEESNRLKSAFLANISHEIRTPMNWILGFLELLKEPDLSETTKTQYVEIVNKSGQRLLNTINDIIEISKIDSKQITVQKSRFCITTLLNNLTDFFQPEAHQKGLIIDSNIPKYIIEIESDKTKLESVFTNLIKNAIKFTDKGNIYLNLELTSKQLNVYVSDTGIGIPNDKKEAIFERFVQGDTSQTRTYEGSGLGLCITREYLLLLKAKIWFKSESDKGTTFYVEFQKSDLKISEESLLPKTSI